MSDKETYLNFPIKHLPLFHQPFWLNAVAGENWDVVIVKKEDEVIATLPYGFKKSNTGIQLFTPLLPQFLGPYFLIEAATPREKLNRETEILRSLAEQLPKFSSAEMRWHFNYQNWLPFYWKKFKQTTRYTYVINNLIDSQKVYDEFNEKIRREIKKGEQQFKVRSENLNLENFFLLLKKNLEKKNYHLPFNESFIRNLYEACIVNDAGKIFVAEDANGKIAAAIFVAWDSTTAYYIIGGKDPEMGNSGAMSFLFWNAFQQLRSKVSSFDFEGSMIEGVESYFRSFGAVQHSFFQLSKYNSSLSFLQHEAKFVFNFLFRKS
ncbi:MAG: GNAT family N-acetyltransferase [Chitinophagales bacterium]|nr:GNAT family N-acetyltransferase [Chitinophagales bacterium]